MKTCVIFNPAARGNKARHFRRHLDAVAGDCAFKATAAAGDARRLAAQSVQDGFDLIVAAGGDGTVNEVLNGLGDVPDGFQRARLGVLPLGTVNVFAREAGIPLRLQEAWKVLKDGRETRVDLPCVDFYLNGAMNRRYFIQLAGAGLDARAIELVSWKLKQRTGPFAYVVAGFKALFESQPCLAVRVEGQTHEGQFVMAGNGQLYGGPFTLFPNADMNSGFLEVCIVPKINFKTLLLWAPRLLLTRRLPENQILRLRGSSFEWTCDTKAGLELDGEWVGHLPASFSLQPGRLRVMAP